MAIKYEKNDNIFDISNYNCIIIQPQDPFMGLQQLQGCIPYRCSYDGLL